MKECKKQKQSLPLGLLLKAKTISGGKNHAADQNQEWRGRSSSSERVEKMRGETCHSMLEMA